MVWQGVLVRNPAIPLGYLHLCLPQKTWEGGQTRVKNLLTGEDIYHDISLAHGDFYRLPMVVLKVTSVGVRVAPFSSTF